ncbi:MAG: hypothetical protein Q8M31_18325 [Beijerinckiaceae bacterium]|nr:hypothetical protein [Beijerinckiaceae bacterium]
MSIYVTVAIFGFALAAPTTALAQAAKERGARAVATQSAPANRAAQKKQRKSAAKAEAKERPVAAKPAPKGFLETIMEGPRLTTTPPEAADWVRASRATQKPQPRAVRAPTRERAVLTGDQIRANEAQLDALRTRHDRIAGRKSPAGKPGSAAGKPETPAVEQYKPGCALNCSTPISVSRSQRR